MKPEQLGVGIEAWVVWQFESMRPLHEKQIGTEVHGPFLVVSYDQERAYVLKYLKEGDAWSTKPEIYEAFELFEIEELYESREAADAARDALERDIRGEAP